MMTAFRERLENQRAAAEMEACLALRALSPIYDAMSADTLAISAKRIVGLMVSAYDDPHSEIVTKSVFGLTQMRYDQGLPLADALEVVAIARKSVTFVMRTSYPNEDLGDDLERLTRASENIARVVMVAYERLLGIQAQERSRVERELRESEERYRSIAERSPLGKCILRAGKVVYANPVMEKLLQAKNLADLMGKDVLEFVPENEHEHILAEIAEVAIPNASGSIFESKIIDANGTTIDVEIMSQSIVYESAPAILFEYVDVSNRKRAEEALMRASATENVLKAQEEMIRALSSPLIPFGNGALLMPLIGHINAGRAIRIVETLANGVVDEQATMAILDVTGVPNVDAEVADALVRAASVVKLLGADVMLTGIQPGIAKIIVELGIDMSQFTIKSSLRDGLSALMRNRDWREGNRQRPVLR